MTSTDPSDRSAGIAVLLVDDDVEWVTAAGAELQDADDALSVITATGGWEALDLLDGESFDCVVCDYRMPDFDGLALLERIRAEYGDVPFILVTGAGSETVASRAISSRVTDYFIKDPEREQSRALAMRVRTAVEAHRTEQALEAARRRFTELFESVPDPVAIADDRGHIRAVNEAFVDMFGGERGDIEGATLDTVVRRTGEATENETDGAAVELVAAETAHGPREFLVRRFRLEPPDSTEYGHVFTDITRQRDRERELERFNELAADVRELLLSTGSREELERTFCETVASTIGGSSAMLARGGDADEVTVQSTAGEVDDRLERALFDFGGNGGSDDSDADPDDGEDHPVAVALSTREPQHVADVSEIPSEWALGVRSRDVREILAVPIERSGIPTGVFVVCSSTPSTLDGTTRDRLEGLVSSLGDAIDLIDRVAALTADRVVRVRASIGDGEAVLVDLGRTTDAAIDVISAIPGGDDTTALYVELEDDDLDEAVAWLDASDDVAGHEVVGDGGRARVRIDATGPTVPATLARQAVAVDSVRIEDGRMTIAFDVPVSGDVRAVIETLEGVYGSVTVDSIRNVERARDGPDEAFPLGDLTDKQRRALETAFHEGYFEQPRAGSADDVAAALDISRSTFLQHLRAAERKLLADLFEWRSAVREE